MRLNSMGFSKERVNEQLRQNAENRYRLFTLEYRPPYKPKKFPLEDELRKLGLFYRVQSMMNKNKNAPARTHGEGEYLLTTKLFCGDCKEMMVGYGGTSKTGRQYHYYMCMNARRKKCGKKIVSKSYIEDRVVNECLKMCQSRDKSVALKDSVLSSEYPKKTISAPDLLRKQLAASDSGVSVVDAAAKSRYTVSGFACCEKRIRQKRSPYYEIHPCPGNCPAFMGKGAVCVLLQA